MRAIINVLAVTALLGMCGCGGENPDASDEHVEHAADEHAGHGEEESGDAGIVEVSAEAQRAGGIRTEIIKRTSVPETFQAMGRIMQDAQKPHHITAGGTGRLETVSGVLGQAVNPGDVLAVIKTPAGAEVAATTPHKGIVTAVHACEGDQVNEMTFLFTLTEVDPLWGVLDIPERSLAAVKAGQKAEIKTAAYPGKAFKGTVAFVSPEIDNISRTVKARVAIENPDSLLKFGMFLDAKVRTGGYLRGVTLRSGAVQNGSAGPFVFVKTGDTDFVPRPVRTGIEKDGLTEIIKGVVPGDKVVVEGAFLLKSEMMKSQLGGDDH
ncbi:MAG: efflux RND transporter periplasmic adaptor subunit [Elusimicrobia bacterium]|nr:efflux RND transporter periplasmic adaptor subunit [Elusimicrobiota bacterium]